MSKYFEEEQLNKYLNKNKDEKMSKLDIILFKIEQIERIVKRLDNERKHKDLIKYNSD